MHGSRGVVTLAALATLMPLAGCGQQPPQVRASAAPRIIFIGDSLTVGLYASDAAHSYAALVTAALHASAQRIATSHAGTLAVDLQAQQETLQPAAAVVVLELGTNDDHTDMSAFRTHYQALLAFVEAAEPQAQLLCLAVWEMPDNLRDTVIRALCPGRYVDVGPIYSTWPDHGPVGRPTAFGPGDWFHPNDAGHAAIAQAVLAALGSAV